jgi:hypothetical protein
MTVKNAHGNPVAYFGMRVPDSVIAYRSEINEKGDRITFLLHQPTPDEAKLPRGVLAAKLQEAGFEQSRPGVMFEDIPSYATDDVFRPFILQKKDNEWMPVDSNADLVEALMIALTGGDAKNLGSLLAAKKAA